MTVSRPIAKYGFSLDANMIFATQANRRLELDNIVTVGGKMVRLVCELNEVNNGKTDAVVDDALARGLDVMLIPYGTTGPISVDTFGAAAATHFAGRVKFWEIANEPDINGWTADGYADFVAGTSDSIKSVDPNATVIAGALWKGAGLGSTTDPMHFVQSLFTRASGKFDAISWHGYDNPLARASWNIWDWMCYWGGSGYCDNGANGGNVRQWLISNGHGDMPYYVTEGGGPILQQDLVTPNYTEAQKATWISSGIDQVAAGQIQTYLVYEMKRYNPQGYSLLDGSNNPVTAYSTFQSQAFKYKTKPKMMM